MSDPTDAASRVSEARPGGPAPPNQATGLDPRSLVVASLVYTGFVTSFPRHALVALSPLALVSALGVACAPAAARSLPRRLLWALPLALGLGLANLWLEPEVAFTVAGMAVSAGALACGVVVLKIVLSVTALSVLTALVPLGTMSHALRRLGAPAVLVTQIVLLGRYLVVLRAEARSMWRARELRAAGSRRARGPRVAAAMVGVLVHRALDRSERVHRALVMRGFTGTLPARTALAWRLRDTVLVVALLAVCTLARAWPWARTLGGGTGG